MTANAQHCDIDFRGLKRRGVVGVLGQRAVTGLTRDMRVYPFALHVEDIGVTGLTSLVASEHHRSGGNVGNGCIPVMTVLSKGLGNKGPAQDQEQYDADGEDRCHPEKVP